jgi:magnesium transporter
LLEPGNGLDVAGNPAAAPAASDLAREHAARDVPVVPPGAAKEEILGLLSARRYESAAHIAVCREGMFLGLIRIEDLLAAPAGARAEAIMDRDPPRVTNGLDREVAAWRAVHHREIALAVVTPEGRFLGIIPPLTLLQVLLREHEEDLSRLGGYLRSTALARASALEKVVRRFGHRLPWILMGLLGGVLSSGIVAHYEEALRGKLVLAFFLPTIVYLADAVGTQTETLLVRGMSVGVKLREVVLREILTGLLIGLVIAVCGFLYLLWRYHQVNVAFGIALSLFAACSTASATAMVLPWFLNRMRVDPAYGSGPLATVIQDILSILIYFLIATRFV